MSKSWKSKGKSRKLSLLVAGVLSASAVLGMTPSQALAAETTIKQSGTSYDATTSTYVNGEEKTTEATYDSQADAITAVKTALSTSTDKTSYQEANKVTLTCSDPVSFFKTGGSFDIRGGNTLTVYDSSSQWSTDPCLSVMTKSNDGATTTFTFDGTTVKASDVSISDLTLFGPKAITLDMTGNVDFLTVGGDWTTSSDGNYTINNNLTVGTLNAARGSLKVNGTLTATSTNLGHSGFTTNISTGTDGLIKVNTLSVSDESVNFASGTKVATDTISAGSASIAKKLVSNLSLSPLNGSTITLDLSGYEEADQTSVISALNSSSNKGAVTVKTVPSSMRINYSDGTYTLTGGTGYSPKYSDTTYDSADALKTTLAELYAGGAQTVYLSDDAAAALSSTTITVPAGKSLDVSDDTDLTDYDDIKVTAGTSAAELKITGSSISGAKSSTSVASVVINSNVKDTSNPWSSGLASTPTVSNLTADSVTVSDSKTAALTNVTTKDLAVGQQATATMSGTTATNLTLSAGSTTNLSGVTATNVTIEGKKTVGWRSYDAATVTGTNTTSADGSTATAALKADNITVGSVDQLANVKIEPLTGGNTVTVSKADGSAFTEAEQATIKKAVKSNTTVKLSSTDAAGKTTTITTEGSARIRGNTATIEKTTAGYKVDGTEVTAENIGTELQSALDDTKTINITKEAADEGAEVTIPSGKTINIKEGDTVKLTATTSAASSKLTIGSDSITGDSASFSNIEINTGDTFTNGIKNLTADTVTLTSGTVTSTGDATITSLSLGKDAAIKTDGTITATNLTLADGASITNASKGKQPTVKTKNVTVASASQIEGINLGGSNGAIEVTKSGTNTTFTDDEVKTILTAANGSTVYINGAYKSADVLVIKSDNGSYKVNGQTIATSASELATKIAENFASKTVDELDLDAAATTALTSGDGTTLSLTKDKTLVAKTANGSISATPSADTTVTLKDKTITASANSKFSKITIDDKDTIITNKSTGLSVDTLTITNGTLATGNLTVGTLNLTGGKITNLDNSGSPTITTNSITVKDGTALENVVLNSAKAGTAITVTKADGGTFGDNEIAAIRGTSNSSTTFNLVDAKGSNTVVGAHTAKIFQNEDGSYSVDGHTVDADHLVSSVQTAVANSESVSIDTKTLAALKGKNLTSIDISAGKLVTVKNGDNSFSVKPTGNTTFTIDGNTLSAPDGTEFDSITVNTGSDTVTNNVKNMKVHTLTVNSGTFDTGAATIGTLSVANGAKVTAKDSTITDANITGGTVDATGSTISGTAKVSGGTVTATNATIPTLTVSGGEVKADGATVTTATVTGGKVTTGAGTKITSLSVSGTGTKVDTTGATVDSLTVAGGDVKTGTSTVKSITATGGTVDTTGATGLSDVTVNSGSKLTTGTTTIPTLTVNGGDVDATGATVTNLTVNSGSANVTDAQVGTLTVNDGGATVGNATIGTLNVAKGDVDASSATVSNLSVTGGTVASNTSNAYDTLSVTGGSVTGDTLTAKSLAVNGGTIAATTVRADTITVKSVDDLASVTTLASDTGSSVTVKKADGSDLTYKEYTKLRKLISPGTTITAQVHGKDKTGDGLKGVPVDPDAAQGELDDVYEQYENVNPFNSKLLSADEIDQRATEIAEIAETNSGEVDGQSEPEAIKAAVKAKLTSLMQQQGKSVVAPSLAGARSTLVVTDILANAAFERTGDLRNGTPASAVGEENGGDTVWLAIKGGKTDVDNSDYGKTKVKVATYQLGYDFQLSANDYLGFFVGSASGSADLSEKYANGKVDIKHAIEGGVYGTHAFQNGQYFDYMLSGGTFDNKYANQQWGTSDFGAALGYGVKIQSNDRTTVNPYIRFKYDKISTDDVTFGGNLVKTDDTNAFSAKIGVNLLDSSGYYGGLAYSRGFSGSFDSYVNGVGMPSNDFDTNVIYFNLGYRGNINDNTMFNVNLEKTFIDYDGWSATGRLEFKF